MYDTMKPVPAFYMVYIQHHRDIVETNVTIWRECAKRFNLSERHAAHLLDKVATYTGSVRALFACIYDATRAVCEGFIGSIHMPRNLTRLEKLFRLLPDFFFERLNNFEDRVKATDSLIRLRGDPNARVLPSFFTVTYPVETDGIRFFRQLYIVDQRSKIALQLGYDFRADALFDIILLAIDAMLTKFSKTLTDNTNKLENVAIVRSLFTKGYLHMAYAQIRKKAVAMERDGNDVSPPFSSLKGWLKFMNFVAADVKMQLRNRQVSIPDWEIEGFNDSGMSWYGKDRP